MRYSRIKNLPGEAGYYHAICRTVGKAFLFESDEEKARLLTWLDKAVDFCGVELQAWCLMSNHVHLLVRVPPRQEVSDAEVHRRMQRLYLPKRYKEILKQWEDWRRIDGDNRRVDAAMARLRARMYDISWFMKTFKQAVAQDYNDRHDYSGSMWGGGRFKSVYLQGSLDVQLSVAAYIHLNPVRAGIVESAEGYRWSSWGEACKGAGRARAGLLSIYNGCLPKGKPMDWSGVKAQLAAIQALAKAKTDGLCADEVSAALDQPMAEASSKTCRKLPLPKIGMLLAEKAPVFTGGPLLGDSGFIRCFFKQRSCAFTAVRQHQRSAPVVIVGEGTICTLADRRFGQSRS